MAEKSRNAQSLEIRDSAAFSAAFSVSRETLARFETYERILIQWQKAVNLVSPASLGHLWHRHFADSAQLAPLVPNSARHLVDLGSGGGFPGLVLAILLEERRLKTGSPSPRITLVESDQRKGAFLREAARSVGVAVEILSKRIESPETQLTVGAVDVVTARAFAPLDRLLSWAAGLFGPDTVGLFLKGRDVTTEMEDARRVFGFDAELVPSLTDPEGRIAVVRHLSRLV
ncbi:MAG: 16S rRNA (guanine(527)-N(7))-methyltransferase RsmG [Hyphomicrobiaceae bacterium]